MYMNFGMSTGASMSKPNKPAGGPPLEYAKDSPLLKVAAQPPIEYLQHQDLGLKRLKKNAEIKDRMKRRTPFK